MNTSGYSSFDMQNELEKASHIDPLLKKRLMNEPLSHIIIKEVCSDCPDTLLLTASIKWLSKQLNHTIFDTITLMSKVFDLDPSELCTPDILAHLRHVEAIPAIPIE